VFDGGYDAATKIYPEYKANDRDRPEDFYLQNKAFQRACAALGLATFNVKGYEADAVIAHFVGKLHTAYEEIWIVSSDKDFYQLIGGPVFVYDDLKDKLVTPNNFHELFHADFPTHLKPIDTLGVKLLSGDSSDNVKGVEGIGEKSAVLIVQKIGGIRSLLMHAKGRSKKMYHPHFSNNFSKHVAWRIEKALASPKKVNAVLKRNYKLMYLSTKNLPVEVRRLRSKGLKTFRLVLKRFELNSILTKYKSWIEPLSRFKEIRDDF
jgi:5'-3' exonuclease